MKKYFFSFFLVFFIFGILSAENLRHALVIGNANYEKLESLANTTKDAREIAEKMSALGYSVVLCYDANLETMSSVIGDWITKLSKDTESEGFFFYTGHGMEVNGDNYLAPIDLRSTDSATVRYGSYPLNQLLDSLKETAKNKVNVVMLDACRSNPFKTLGGTKGDSSKGFASIEINQDIFVLFATAPGQTASDGIRGRNSPFAEAFLIFLNSSNVTEPLHVMAGHIARETMNLTDGRQRPYFTGSITSNFFYSLGLAIAPDSPGTMTVVNRDAIENLPEITIVNNTGSRIYYVLVSESSSTTWGNDRLDREYLLDGQTVTVQLNSPLNVTNRYDLMLVDGDIDDSNTNTYTRANVLIRQNDRIVFTANDKDRLSGVRPQNSTETQVTLVNETGGTIFLAYFSKASDTKWGDDVLDRDQFLLNGQSTPISLKHSLTEANRYDIMLVDIAFNSYTKRDVLIIPNSRIVFTTHDKN